MKSLVAVVSFAAVLLAAAACGDGGEPAATPAPTDGATPEPGAPAAGKIAFVSFRDGNAEIYVINANGDGLINLTNDPAVDLSPSWSPDGARIAFVSDRGGELGFYVMSADGSDVVRIAGAERIVGRDFQGGFPAWSPDGSKIAFVSRGDVNSDGFPVVNIYVMDADGSNPTRLTDPPKQQNPDTGASAQDTFPAWSPDGGRIAFASDRPGRGDYDIFIMDSDGSNLTNLTENAGVPGPDQVVAERGWDTFPALSPDGSRIAFVSNRDDNWEVYVMSADGSGQKNITNSPEEDGLFGVAWSQDGDRIAFTRSSAEDAPQELWVMNANGSEQTRIADDGSSPAWSPVP